jgi:hypothetical protein
MAKKMYARQPHPSGEPQVELAYSSGTQRNPVYYGNMPYDVLKASWSSRPGTAAAYTAHDIEKTHRKWKSLGKKARHGAKVKI